MNVKFCMTETARIADLRDSLTRGGAAVLGRDDEEFAQARALWNGAVAHEPALVVRCRTVADVQLAVLAAQAHRTPLSVRGGGHDWAGRALRQDGLVLDLSGLRQVTVDATAKVARVAGGATAADVSAAAGRYDLAAVTGNAGAVGMAGLLLGGGYGPLTTRFGLALDNLLGAEIVLADGRLVSADAAKNADLFWALRGGGGNFGVVTSMRLRLHPVSELLAGLLLFPWSEAATVLRDYAKMMSSAPDELSVLAGLVPAPDGSPLLFLGPVWSGEPATGGAIMDRLTCLGMPIVSRVGPMSPSDLLALYDAHIVNGRHHALRTHWLADLTPEIVAAVAAAGAARTSPQSLIALHRFHGAGTRVPPGATAFGERRAHYMIEIIAAWDPADADNGARHRQWAQDLSSILAPLALPGGYPNLLTAENREQVAAAYGANGARLRKLKQRYDPDDVFSSAIPLPA